MGEDAAQTGWENVGKKTKRKAHNTSIVNEATFKDLTRKNRCHEDVGRIGLISGRQPQAKARASPRISTRSPSLANDCNILSRPKSTACNSRSEREWREESEKGQRTRLGEGENLHCHWKVFNAYFYFTSVCFFRLSGPEVPTAHRPRAGQQRFPFPVSSSIALLCVFVSAQSRICNGTYCYRVAEEFPISVCIAKSHLVSKETHLTQINCCQRIQRYHATVAYPATDTENYKCISQHWLWLG